MLKSCNILMQALVQPIEKQPNAEYANAVMAQR